MTKIASPHLTVSRRLLPLVALLLGGVLSAGGCGETIELFDGGLDAHASLQTGTPCGEGGECVSGQCVDGVCCESACNGTCESCNTSGHPGECEPIADGQDPAMECGGMPVPDGGGVPLIDGGINGPDGGAGSLPAACAGTCNGARACKLPGKEKACGDHFCNDTTLELGFSCNGSGGCELQPTPCVAYSCGPDACKTSCTSPSDCLSTHYCNASGQCVPRKNAGVACSLGSECTTGFCAGDSGNPASTKVCCNSACTGIPGASCINPGKEGTCECSKNCATGSCVLTYPDADGDGFGNPLGATTVECSDALPAGRVINNTDCYDNNPHAYPGPRKDVDQTCSGSGFFRCCYDNYFKTQRGDGSFDYNCDGVEKHEQNEWPVGTVCHFCDQVNSCVNSDTMCATSGEGSTLAACGPKTACFDSNNVFTGYTCGSCNLIFLLCGGPNTNNTGFIGTVACGASATRYNCGACSAANGAPSNATTFTQQGCL